MPTVNNITWDYLGEYTEEYTPDGQRAVIYAATDWTTNNVFAFPAAMLGTQRTGGGNSISRDLPYQHPEKPWLWCSECKLARGVGAWNEDSVTMIQFVKGPAMTAAGRTVYECVFTDLSYDVLTDAEVNTVEMRRFVTRKERFAMENLPIPRQTFTWLTAPSVACLQPLTLAYPVIELTYKQWWVPEPFRESYWAANIGRVNAVQFDAPFASNGVTTGLGGGVQTVLFLNYEVEKVRDAAMQRCGHITFSFLYRPGGWNRFFRRHDINAPLAPSFDVMVDKATGTRGPYRVATGASDLNGLFLGGP